MNREVFVAGATGQLCEAYRQFTEQAGALQVSGVRAVLTTHITGGVCAIQILSNR